MSACPYEIMGINAIGINYDGSDIPNHFQKCMGMYYNHDEYKSKHITFKIHLIM